MAFEYVRGYVQLASGLGELTRARAMEAAQGLLSLPGAEEVGRRAMQVTEFADQLLEAARANRESLVAMVRTEVESALGRSDVVHLADLELARTALAALTREVDDLRRTVLAEASRGPLGKALPGAAAAISTIPRPAARPAPAAEVTVAVAAGTERAAGEPAAKKAAAKKATARKGAAKKTTAKKTTAKRTTAKKTTARETAAEGPATKRTAKKGTAKKGTAKKAATGTTSTTDAAATAGSTATKTTAKKAATRKAATTRATAKKATAKKVTAKTAPATESAPAPATPEKPVVEQETTAPAATEPSTAGATASTPTATGNDNG